jgi:hypothetical protein
MTSQTALSAWRAGGVREQILDFVQRVTQPDGPEFVPPPDRVAVFDNDGTLWCEKPTYTQAFFVLQRLGELTAAKPELRDQEPYRALLAGDHAALAALSPGDIARVVLQAHAGLTPEEFNAAARRFLDQAQHPRFGVRFTALTYVPMLELLAYLRAHDFRVFIATGGGVEFVRAVSEEIYGVSRDDVIGSAVQLAVDRSAGTLRLVRQAAFWGSPDEGDPKPINIQGHIGRRPILAAGNSAGDKEMLEYTQARDGASLCLLVNHDDEVREYAYASRGATTHETEPILDTAARLGWTVVSMKADFRTVFASQPH